MINHKITDLEELIKLLNEFETIECKPDDVILLKSIKWDLEELQRLRKENKHLKEQLEFYKLITDGLSSAYRESIGAIDNEE